MEQEPSLDVVLGETRIQLERQFQTIDSLDTKAGIIIGFTGVVLGVFVRMRTTPFGSMLSGIGAGLLLGSIFAGIVAFFLRGYRADPEPEALESLYLKKESRQTKRQILANYVESYDENRKKISDKTKALRYSLVCLFPGVFLCVKSAFSGG